MNGRLLLILVMVYFSILIADVITYFVDEITDHERTLKDGTWVKDLQMYDNPKTRREAYGRSVLCVIIVTLISCIPILNVVFGLMYCLDAKGIKTEIFRLRNGARNKVDC